MTIEARYVVWGKDERRMRLQPPSSLLREQLFRYYHIGVGPLDMKVYL